MKRNNFIEIFFKVSKNYNHWNRIYVLYYHKKKIFKPIYFIYVSVTYSKTNNMALHFDKLNFIYLRMPICMFGWNKTSRSDDLSMCFLDYLHFPKSVPINFEKLDPNWFWSITSDSGDDVFFGNENDPLFKQHSG